jgi:hypothetical protein
MMSQSANYISNALWTSFLCKVNFSRQIFFCILEKGNLAGKKLLGKRFNLLYKEGFSMPYYGAFKIQADIIQPLKKRDNFQEPTHHFIFIG